MPVQVLVWNQRWSLHCIAGKLLRKQCFDKISLGDEILMMQILTRCYEVDGVNGSGNGS